MIKTVATSKQIAFENYERGDSLERSTERSFGLVFAIFFIIIAILKHGYHLSQAYPWLLASAVMFAITFIYPAILKPFNKLWMRFGALLYCIVNPVVMGVLFFCVLTPMGLLARAFKWDPLRLRLLPHEKTYWITREPSQITNLKNQF